MYIPCGPWPWGQMQGVRGGAAPCWCCLILSINSNARKNQQKFNKIHTARPSAEPGGAKRPQCVDFEDFFKIFPCVAVYVLDIFLDICIHIYIYMLQQKTPRTPKTPKKTQTPETQKNPENPQNTRGGGSVFPPSMS